jgi:2'-5' RNA ligase
LDKGTIGKLHQMAVQVQNRIQQQQQSMACNDDSAIVVTTEHAQKEEEEYPPIKKKVAKPLRFKPRSQASLHMTLFFGGETLCELPANELQEWHSQVSERLHASGFYLQGNHLPISSTTSDGDFSFQVTGLKIFPPQRNNLIVAILDPASDWHTLYGDLRAMAKDESLSPALAEITKYSKSKWIAHITLGSLMGGQKAESKALGSLLDEVFSECTGGMKGIPASTCGIAIGGPIPEQAALNWDFRYSPNSATNG